MAQYNVSFDLALSPISSHPNLWLPDAVNNLLMPDAEAVKFRFTNQIDDMYSVEFYLSLNDDALHPRKWLFDTVFKNLEEVEYAFNFEYAEC